MEFFFLLLLLAAGAYLFFKSNTKRGLETVRAHVFLGGMTSGASVQEANFVASLDAMNLPDGVVESAINHLKAEYGGKQLSMIADAYRRGMTPKLPLWYRLVGQLHTTHSP